MRNSDTTSPMLVCVGFAFSAIQHDVSGLNSVLAAANYPAINGYAFVDPCIELSFQKGWFYFRGVIPWRLPRASYEYSYEVNYTDSLAPSSMVDYETYMSVGMGAAQSISSDCLFLRAGLELTLGHETLSLAHKNAAQSSQYVEQQSAKSDVATGINAELVWIIGNADHQAMFGDGYLSLRVGDYFGTLSSDNAWHAASRFGAGISNLHDNDARVHGLYLVVSGGIAL